MINAPPRYEAGAAAFYLVKYQNISDFPVANPPAMCYNNNVNLNYITDLISKSIFRGRKENYGDETYHDYRFKIRRSL